MNDKNEALKQALECIERLNKHGWILADFEDEVYATLASLKAALEQQPVQEPSEAALQALARRCLWIAYCWNDHNFKEAYTYARLTAQKHGVHNFDEANEWITAQPVQEPDRRALQAAGAHPAPCARHCEAKAFEIEIRSLKSALKQQQAEPVACRFCFSEKGCWTWQCHNCGEIDDVQKPAPPPVQEPVSMRMPKVGDKVICLEDESLGEVVSLTAGGSPDITFNDGSRGTYLLHEFAELFGYAEQRQPLTDEQIKVIHFDLCNTVGSDYKTVARAIEAAHGIKEQS